MRRISSILLLIWIAGLSGEACVTPSTLPDASSSFPISDPSDLEKGTAVPPDAKQWLTENALEIATSEPSNSFYDLTVLDSIVGAARIVALGETTHGTREFFQLKHRILQYLVEKKGFSVLALEASMAEAYQLNAYVLEGRGNARQALAALGFWTWNTKEVLELVEWMRSYNAAPSHVIKVYFYGFDMQAPYLALDTSLHCVESMSPGALSEPSRQALLPLKNSLDIAALQQEGHPELLPKAMDAARSLEQAILHQKPLQPNPHWRKCARLARNVVQYLEMTMAENDDNARDRAMAENLRWILDEEQPGSKVVIWAHNAHVMRSRLGVRDSMGAILSDALSGTLRVFGFCFFSGSFRALEVPRPKAGPAVHSFTVGPPPNDTIDAAFASSSLGNIAIWNLQAIPLAGPVRQWWNRPLRSPRQLGAAYNDAWRENEQYAPLLFPQSFDALIFVKHTTSAIPIEGITTETFVSNFVTVPTNLDFEIAGPTGGPEAWPLSRGADFGYKVRFDSDSSSPKSKALHLYREPGQLHGEEIGMVGQRIDPAPMRGKKVNLKAQLRADIVPGGGEARMFLQIANSEFGPPSFLNTLADRPVLHSRWSNVEITADVPEQATRFHYGFALIGEEALWADDVPISID